MRKNINKKKIRTIALAGSLAGVLCVGGIMAYFTDGDVQNKSFTVGKVSIDLQEPSWKGTVTNVVPGQVIDKDPQIKNTSTTNSAYAFMTVKVPYAKVQTSDETGNVTAAKDTELVNYTVNDDWVEITATTDNYVASRGALDDNETDTIEAGGIDGSSLGIKNETDKTVTEDSNSMCSRENRNEGPENLLNEAGCIRPDSAVKVIAAPQDIKEGPDEDIFEF